MRRLEMGAAVVLLVAAGCQKKGSKFETVPIERGNLTARITATGTLSALVTVQVGSQVSGRIQAINVDFNSPVKKGELIAKIDPSLYDAAVEQARANYVAADGNLAKARAQAVDARRQYDRNKELRAKDLIAQADLDTSQANADAMDASVKAAQGALEQARANLHQAEVNLQYTNIVSPTDGTVISRSVDVGQTVAASLQAPTLFTIAEDLRKMQVDTSVAEADVGKLQDGMEATFTVDAYPTERFKGRIRQIRNAAQTVQNVVTYDAVIDVENPDLKLRPGMTANVTVVYAQRKDTLKVANAALRFRPPADFGGGGRGSQGGQGGWVASAAAAPQGGGPRAGRGSGGGGGMPDADQRTIWILRGGQPQRATVHIGVSDGTTTEITSGDVEAGDAAITDASTDGSAPARPQGNAFRRMF